MPASNKKKIALILIVGLACMIGLVQFYRTQAVDVSVAALETINLSDSITVKGQIEAREKYETVLNSSQKVIKLYKKEGEEVKAGDIIAVLDTADLQYQLDKAVLSRDSLMINITNMQDQAAINLNNARNEYTMAQKFYRNTKQLYDAGAASKDDFDTADHHLKSAENQVKLAEIQYNNWSLNTYDSNIKKQLEQADLTIQDLNRRISESTITTPSSGTLTLLEASENQYPAPSKGQVQVIDLNRLMVKADVSQYNTSLLKPGQKAVIKIKGLEKNFTGQVTSVGDISATASASSGVKPKYKVEIAIDHPEPYMKVGYEANVDIFLNEKNGVPAVASRDIHSEDGNRYVFVVSGGKAQKRYVTTGLETEPYVEILEGLFIGEPYITSPPDNLKEGDRVKQV